MPYILKTWDILHHSRSNFEYLAGAFEKKNVVLHSRDHDKVREGRQGKGVRIKKTYFLLFGLRTVPLCDEGNDGVWRTLLF